MHKAHAASHSECGVVEKHFFGSHFEFAMPADLVGIAVYIHVDEMSQAEAEPKQHNKKRTSTRKNASSASTSFASRDR